MAENKTRPTKVSPLAFVKAAQPDQRRLDGLVLLELFAAITGLKPEMWGPSIVGFGRMRYRTEAGREGDICLTGFSPRKASLVLYIGKPLQDKKLMAGLGKHKTGSGCLYINKLDDVDLAVLKKLIAASVKNAKAKDVSQKS